MFSIIALDEDRQSPAVEIEGNFVDFLELMIWVKRGRQFVVFENRDVEQVLKSGLEVAVEIGVLENSIKSSPYMSRQRFKIIRSCVSVPVLSVHRTSMAPKFWMALRRFTITFLRDMAIAPLARFTVTIIGNISGVSPTATATAKRSASSQSCFVRPLIRKTVGTITKMKRIISQVNLLIPWSKAVGTRRPAIW